MPELHAGNDRKMNSLDYFAPWNFHHELNIVLPELYNFGSQSPEDETSFNKLTIRFFDQAGEVKELQKNNSILYGRNFNQQALELCQTAESASQVLDVLLANVPEGTPYLGYIINGTPTGLPLEVASRRNFQLVICHGLGTQYGDMLLRNFNLFTLSNKVIFQNEYNGLILDQKFRGVIVFIDKVYSAFGTYFVDIDCTNNLIDFIYNNKAVATAFVVRVERDLSINGFDVFRVAGTSILINQNQQIKPLANQGGLLHLGEAAVKPLLAQALPVRPYQDSIYHNLKVTKSQEIPGQALDLHIMGSKVPGAKVTIPSQLWRTICQEVRKIDPSNVPRNSPEWRSKFQKMVAVFLRTMVQGSELEGNLAPEELKGLILKMVNGENMKKHWIRAVMHETVNAQHNYEQLEAMGDRYAEASFINFVYQNYPDSSPEVINALVNEYLATGFFSEFSRQLNLPAWTLSDFFVDDNIAEDVMEAWFGALYLSAESYQPGFGLRVVNVFVNAIYSDLDLMANDVGIGSKATKHEQYNLGPGVKLYSSSEEIRDNIFKYIIKINPKAVEYFRSKGINTSQIKTNLSIVGVGGTKKTAKNDANNKLYAYLKQFGISYEWMSQLARKDKLTGYPKNNELLAQVRMKALREGITNVDYKTVDKDGPYIGYILFGERADGSKVILSAMESARLFNLSNKDTMSVALMNLFQAYLSR